MDKKKLNFKIIALISAATFLGLLILTALTASLFPQTRFSIVKYLSKGRDIKERITIYEKFADKYSSFIPARLTAAKANMQWGFFSPDNTDFINKAITLYGEVLKKDPQNREALQDLGFIYSQREDFDKSKEYYTKLIELDPKNSSYQLNLARLYLQTDKLNTALEKTKEALDLDANNNEAHMLNVAIYEKMNDFASALYSCEKALSGYTATGNKDKALSARFQLGRLYLKAGLTIQAMQEYEKIIKARPDFLTSYVVLADTYLKLGMPDKSISLILNSPLNPLFSTRDEVSVAVKAQSYYVLGQAYLRKSDYIAARTYFKKAEVLGVEFKQGFFENLENVITRSGQEKALTTLGSKSSPYPESSYKPQSPYPEDVYEAPEREGIEKTLDDYRQMVQEIEEGEVTVSEEVDRSEIERSIEELQATAKEAQGSWAPTQQDQDRSGVEKIIKEYQTLKEKTKKAPEGAEQKE